VTEKNNKGLRYGLYRTGPKPLGSNPEAMKSKMCGISFFFDNVRIYQGNWAFRDMFK
jgi:hypothetical protein